MTDGTYNGWRNYPTWCVNLWLGNDEGSYNEARKLVSAPIDLLGAESSYSLVDPPRRRRLVAADRLKRWVRDIAEPDEASLCSDLVGYALDEVDWLELAEPWLEDVDEDEDDERPRFVVVENTPGYLREDDEPATFGTFDEAREYASERVAELIEHLHEAYSDEGGADVSVSGSFAEGDSSVLVSDERREHDLGRVVEILPVEDAGEES